MSLISCRGLQDPFLPLLISLISRWPPPYHRSATTCGALLVRFATTVRAHSWGVIGYAVIFLHDNLVIAVVSIVVGGFDSIKAIVRGLVGLSTTCNTHQLHSELSLLSQVDFSREHLMDLVILGLIGLPLVPLQKLHSFRRLILLRE